MDPYSYLGNADPSAIEGLYNQYLKNPEAVDAGWRDFFKGFDFARSSYEQSATPKVPENVLKEFSVISLINGYRTRGHLFTKTNPVRERRKYYPTNDIENFGLSADDLDKVFVAGNEIGIGPSKLKDILAHLEATYCQSVGAEYKYIRNPEVISWLEKRMETRRMARTQTACTS